MDKPAAPKTHHNGSQPPVLSIWEQQNDYQWVQVAHRHWELMSPKTRFKKGLIKPAQTA